MRLPTLRFISEFGEKLTITAVVTDLWEIDGLENPQEWVLVSPFLNDRDIAEVEEQISQWCKTYL